MTTPTRSALFVDFDNVYLGLQDRSVAQLFATEPDRWVQWLSDGADRPASRGRRFLLKLCYLSPDPFGGFREHFVRAGFRVVDCPTIAGKNSADIHLVIDALDTLAADTRYDEFVIASADADFAPLLHRLRAHDRMTAVLRGGPAAPAYTSLCDSVLTPKDVAGALLGGPKTQPAEPLLRAAKLPTQRRSARGSVEAAVAAVRQVVADSPVPVTGNAASQAAQNACTGIAPGWAGARTFGGFVTKNLDDLTWTGKPSPGYVYDPTRQRMSDLAASTT